MAKVQERRVDHTAIRVSQAFTIGMLVLSFILNSQPLVGVMAVVLLVGGAFPRAALFKQMYQQILRPVGLLRPDVVVDDPEPHQFAMWLGGTFVLLALAALLLGLTVVGWALVWLVVFLASANLFLGFCAGCFLYYQLNHYGIPGFRHSRIGRT